MASRLAVLLAMAVECREFLSDGEVWGGAWSLCRMAAGTPRPPGWPPQSRLTAGCVTGKCEVPAGQVLGGVPGGSSAGLSRAPGRGSGREPLQRPHVRRPPEAESGMLPGSFN